MTAGAAIVTGAGSGIGRAVALRLAGAGWAVLAQDLRPERAEAVAAEIGAAGGRAAACGGDVSREADAAATAARCRDAFGDCAALVNNAGHAHQARFLSIDPSEFDRMLAVHLRGAFLCTRAVLPAMLAQGVGAVVNVASQLGQIGGVELAHYAAAKAGLIGMTKALAREVAAEGVRVNAVAPGPINTPLVAGLSEEWRARKAAELPLRRFGEPEEVAEAVLFLVSPAASLFVGQTLGPNSGDVML